MNKAERMDILRGDLGELLEEARKLFKEPEQRRLTILVRQAGEPERDCCVSDDTPEGVREIVARRLPSPSPDPGAQGVPISELREASDWIRGQTNKTKLIKSDGTPIKIYDLIADYLDKLIERHANSAASPKVEAQGATPVGELRDWIDLLRLLRSKGEFLVGTQQDDLADYLETLGDLQAMREALHLIASISGWDDALVKGADHIVFARMGEIHQESCAALSVAPVHPSEYALPAPVAAVAVSRLRELVDRWHAQAAGDSQVQHAVTRYFSAKIECADSLEALIKEGEK